ncbi:hypothetical protein DTO195F2_5439 [Paecilomyces variotii]|nr:hypothetical protein DTO195F2_5439 [Paecilomyces variotii]
MSEATTVHVSGIAPTTSDKEVRDFFSFCGKITMLSVTPESGEPNAPKSATVHFEKETAAKTAISSTTLSLTASASDAKDENHHELDQEDKPRSRIIAEYLAHGYVVSDQAIQKAIALDQKHGISNRFTTALSNFDKKYQATERAKGLDESYKITDKATSGWKGLNSYFEKALGTPTGRKVRDFYVKTDKQVRDIHAEARRLADLKSGKISDTDEKPVETSSAAPAGATDTAPAEAPKA